MNATPSMRILSPFIVLVGLDLVLNMFVLTKRTIDYFIFGQLPSTEPWW